MGEEAPAQETHENHLPAPYPITWQSLRDLSEILTENEIGCRKEQGVRGRLTCLPCAPHSFLHPLLPSACYTG